MLQRTDKGPHVQIKSYHLYEMFCGVVSLTLPTFATRPVKDLLRTTLFLKGHHATTQHSDRQRAALLDLPRTAEADMLHHFTLSDDDLEIIRARRRPHNRFGFALQLCALRYPGRLLTPGEVIPLAVTRFLAAPGGPEA